MNLLGTIRSYGKIERPVRLVIATEFFIQLINIAFMNMQPLFMKAEHYSNPEIASLTASRFAGVLLFALPLGIIIRGKKVKGLFMIAAIFVPFFALLNVYFIPAHNTLLVHISQFMWGASFTFMQIPIIPFILRNCNRGNHTGGIALSYSTYSFAGIASGFIISALDFIDPVFFNERMILILISVSGFFGVWIMTKVQLDERTVETRHRIRFKGSYDWGLIFKALIPTLIIAMGAGLTIPFISLFFEEVHHFDKGDFSVISSIAAILVAWAALMVPSVKNTIGYKIAIPTSQSLAVISLVALATTQFYNHMPVAVAIAVVCYLLRQPLMNMAGPMTTEVVMNYVGEKNQEIVSALISAIWNGSYFLSGIFVAILFANGVKFVNVFLITASLYAVGVIWYYFLILDYNRREKEGLIEKGSEY